MKALIRFTLMLLLALSCATALAGSKYAVASGNWTATSTWSLTRGGASGAAVPAATDTVWIPSPYMVTVDVSAKQCYNLIIESGGVLIGVGANPTSSQVYLRMTGDSVHNDGIIGFDPAASTVMTPVCFEAFKAGGTLTFNGTGTSNISRIRGGNNLSNLTIVFDQNVTLTYNGSSGTGGSAIYPAQGSGTNNTVVINAGRTVTGVDQAYVTTTSSVSTDGTSSTWIINGTLNIPGGNFSIRTATGSTGTLTVGSTGTMKVGKSIYPTESTGANTSTITVNSGGKLEIGTSGSGTADFTTATQTVTGGGTFALDSGATIKVGAATGLDPATGPIRTTTRNFSTSANYRFVGTVAQVTGPNLPATVHDLGLEGAGITISNPVSIIRDGTLTLGGNNTYTNLNTVTGYTSLDYSASVAQTAGSELGSVISYLTINNSNGVTVSGDLRVDSSLTLTSGKLIMGSHTLTVGGLATLSGGGAGAFVEGTLSRVVAPVGPMTWPIGIDSVYMPVTLYYSGVNHSGAITIGSLNKNTTPLGGMTFGATEVLNRYFHVTADTSVQIQVDSVSASYAAGDIPATTYASYLQVDRWDGYSWVHLNVNRIDSTNKVIYTSGNMGPGDWVITGPAGFFAPDTTSFDVGTVSPTLSKTDSIVVTNTGNRTLTVDSARSNNPMFTLTPPTTASIAPSASHTFYFSFSPTSPGAKSGYISFYHSGLSGLDFVQVNGTGGDMTVFAEDFTGTAGTALTAAGWTQSGSSATNPISITAGSLSFLHYSASGAGNSASLTTSGQDVYSSFPTLNAGSVYLAFMMNVASAGTGDYFIALSPSSLQTNYYARLHVKSTTGGYLLGISKSNEVSGGAQYGTTVLPLNTTCLVVVKYTFIPPANTADTTNDVISVFGFSSDVPGVEPATAEISAYGTATKSDASDLAFVTLRQGSSGAAAALTIDGIRIGTTWSFGVPTAVKTVQELPTTYELANNYPNPFNPATTIQYGLPHQSQVSVKVYSILGQEVRTLVDGLQGASYYRVTWNGRDNDGMQVSSGVYFFRMTAQPVDGKIQPFTQVRKMLLMK